MKFKIVKITDTLILLADLGDGRTITNSPDPVINYLQNNLVGGLLSRRVFYRDTNPEPRYDELTYNNGTFRGFAPCSDSQQTFLASFEFRPNNSVIELDDNVCISG